MTRTALSVCSADWHVDHAGRGAWPRRPDISGDSWCSLRQIIDICLARRLPLLGAGDLFDVSGQDDSSAISFVMSQMDRLANAGLDCLYNQGQHEKVLGVPWLGLHDRPKHVNRRSVAVGPLMLYGLDHHRPEDLSGALGSVPDSADVLMAHQVWLDFMGEHIGGELSFKEVPHARLLLTGDFHSHRVVSAINAHGKPLKVLSPGSTCLRSIVEEDQKSIFILYDDLSVESVPLCTRAIHRRNANSADDLGELLLEIPQLSDETPGGLPEIRKPILHVTYDSSLGDVYRRLTTAIAGRFHLYLTPRCGLYTSVEPAKSHDGQQTIARGLRGNLTHFTKESTEEYKLAARLLDSDSPGQVLIELSQEVLGG